MKLDKDYTEKGLSYSQYLQTVKAYFDRGLITGKVQTPGYLDYTRVNLQRYSRLEKTVVLNEALRNAIDKCGQPLLFLVLTEGWCGDAAQNIGVFEAIRKYKSSLEVKYLFRDENPELMNLFLTNGSRSIPKAICLNRNMDVLFHWGPRPAALQEKVQEMIASGVDKEQRGLFIHSWYHQDHTQSTQSELAALIRALE